MSVIRILFFLDHFHYPHHPFPNPFIICYFHFHSVIIIVFIINLFSCLFFIYFLLLFLCPRFSQLSPEREVYILYENFLFVASSLINILNLFKQMILFLKFYVFYITIEKYYKLILYISLFYLEKLQIFLKYHHI